MATTKTTSHLVRFLHTLNRFKEVYIEENEIIGEPLFEGLPELRIRENPDGTYQIHIKGSDVSFILESLQHYFSELGFTGQIVYSSITLPKSVIIESMFFSESEYLNFQEFVDYLEYDSHLGKISDSESEISEIILNFETIIIFTRGKVQVDLPEELLLTSEIKNLITTAPRHERKHATNLSDSTSAIDSSLTSTLDKLMSVETEIRSFAEYVLGTAWYELTPQTPHLIRFDPVVRKIPEIYARYSSNDRSIYVGYPDVAPNNKFISKIMEFFDNSSYRLESESYRFLLSDNLGVITIDVTRPLLAEQLEHLLEIVENGLGRFFGESRKFKLRKYTLMDRRTKHEVGSLTKSHDYTSSSRDEMTLREETILPESITEPLRSLSETYPDDYYEIDLSVLLNVVNSSGVLDSPLTLEELEVLLFINERKSKKVQSNIVMKKLGLKREKAKELLKKLADQGWFKVSHGWYSLRPSKAKLLEEFIEDMKNLQYMPPEELNVSQEREIQKIPAKNSHVGNQLSKPSVEGLTPEEMKTLLLKEKMEKEFNEDIDDFYSNFEEESARVQSFSPESDYDFGWNDEWDQNLGHDVGRISNFDEIDDSSLEFEKLDMNLETPDELQVSTSHENVPEKFDVKRIPKSSIDASATRIAEKPFMDDLSEEERLYLQKKRLESMQRERTIIKSSTKTRKALKKIDSEEKQVLMRDSSAQKHVTKAQDQKISLNDHLKSLSIAGFTDEEIQVILALLNYKEDKMVFKSLVKHTTLKKTRLKKIVKELVKKGVIKRLRGDYVTIDYESPNPNLKEVLKLKDRLNERKSSVWNIKLSDEELKVIQAMAKHKEFKAQSNVIANEVGLSKQKTKEILRKFAAAGICNVTRGWYALNERVVKLILGDEQWESMKRQYQPPLEIPQPKVPLTDEEKMIYDAIKSQKSLKAQSNLIARKTGLDREQIRKILRNLVDKGILRVRHGWYCIILPES